MLKFRPLITSGAVDAPSMSPFKSPVVADFGFVLIGFAMSCSSRGSSQAGHADVRPHRAFSDSDCECARDNSSAYSRSNIRAAGNCGPAAFIFETRLSGIVDIAKNNRFGRASLRARAGE